MIQRIVVSVIIELMGLIEILLTNLMMTFLKTKVELTMIILQQGP